MREKPRACKTIDEMQVGDRVEVIYTITEDDLRKFAEISGDWNPLHFDDEYASKTMFKQRVAHGMISLAKFSGIFGMDLPGLGTLWEAQEVKFVAPVLLDKPYTAIAEVTEKQRKRIVLETWVECEDGERVLEGTATVIPISDLARRRMT